MVRGICVENETNRERTLHVDTKKISVLCFPKYLSTDILKNIRLEPSKMRRQIFQNRYFYLIYVICLERHEKTDKIGTDNEYSEKKRRFASHHPGTLETPHPKIEKKYTISVSARTKIQPKNHH